MVQNVPPSDNRKYYEVVYHAVRNDIHTTGSILFKSANRQLAINKCLISLEEDGYEVCYVSAHPAETD